MSIEAFLQTDSNGDITIQLRGSLGYDSGHMLKTEIISVVNTYPVAIITLDFCHVEFVGSSGIGQFVETFNALKEMTHRLQLRHVKPEFIKVFKLYNLVGIEEISMESEEESGRLREFWKLKKVYESNA
jgi:anti-anti-sigma factor